MFRSWKLPKPKARSVSSRVVVLWFRATRPHLCMQRPRLRRLLPAHLLQRQPLAFPVGMAADGTQLTRELGNMNGGLPFTVFLGADGKLRQRKIGELSAQDLAKWAQS